MSLNPKYENTGIMSRNKDRQGDKQPEFKGSAQVNGVEYWISAWVNEKDGGKYFKLSFKRKDDRQKPASEPQPDLPSEDDVPF